MPAFAGESRASDTQAARRATGAGQVADACALCGDGSRVERWVGLGVALLVALFVAAGVTPELAMDCTDLNDSTYHLAIAQRMKEALARGESPIDFWYPDIALGFPLLRHYQYLPHVFLVGVDAVVGRFIPLDATYRIVLGTLLAVFPLAMYGALRWLGLRPLAAGCSAVIAPLLSTPHLYGLGFESYLWGGSGLFAQLFASVLAPLGFAAAYRAVATGRGLGRAALLIAATFASQLVYGYMLALSTVVLVISGSAKPPQKGTGTSQAEALGAGEPVGLGASPLLRWAAERLRRAGRLALLLIATFLIGSSFFVPALKDAEFANHSVCEMQEKMDSLGAKVVLQHLVAGRLFDRNRLPVVTILAALGLLYAVWRGGTPLRLLAGLCVAWLLLYFGRPTWHGYIDYLPLARDIPLHRFIGGVQLFAIPLAGCGLAFVWQCLPTSRRWSRIATTTAVLGVLLAPAIVERATYLYNSHKWKQDAAVAVAADTDLQPLLALLRTLKDGRVYVGIPTRAAENLRVGGIPMTAFCLLDNIDTLGFLWIAITYAGDVQTWFVPDNPLHCQIFGVRYLVFAANRRPPAFAQLIADLGRYRVYEVPDVSYFGLVDVPYAIRCTKRNVYNVGHAWLNSLLPIRGAYPALLIGRVGAANLPVPPVNTDNPNAMLPPLAGPISPPGVLARTADSWSCVADLDRPAVVVRRTGYHPGLRATVDGAPAPVFPVTPGFAAIEVPEGRHEIRFSYVPATRWPWWLAAVLALVLVTPAARWLRLDGQRPGTKRSSPVLPPPTVRAAD